VLPVIQSASWRPAGGSPSPDIPNWAWHEYGNRVGFWRLLKAIDAIGVKAVLAINGTAVKSYAPIAQAALERGWEFIGHGYTQKNMQKVDDEAADIAATTEAIAAFTGTRPRGWLGPGLTETWHTPDLLVEAGYEYVCDWVLDDQPVRLATRTTPIVNIPYTQECNADGCATLGAEPPPNPPGTCQLPWPRRDKRRTNSRRPSRTTAPPTPRLYPMLYLSGGGMRASLSDVGFVG